MLRELLKGIVMETVLKSEKILVERKAFYLDLKENARGRFLRITEDVNGHRDTIILPAPGMEQFVRVINDMIDFDEETSRQSGQPDNRR